VCVCARARALSLVLTCNSTANSAAGQVFSALDKQTNRKVAIKKMKLDEESSKLLASEIHMMKSSNHGNIVDYVESYIVGGELWARFTYGRA